MQIQFGLRRHPEQAFHNVRLDGHQQNFQLAARRRAQNLIIPHHLRQRKRHVLLRLVLDDLVHLARIHRRQLDKFGKDMEARRANIHLLDFKPFFRNDRLQGRENQFFPRGFLRAFQAERFDGKIVQPQAA